MIKKWLVLAVVGLAVQPASAWNSLGHRTVAELAWRQMDSHQREKAAELLKHHPHYESILTAGAPAGEDKGKWAFLTAAVWPDMIRPAKKGEPDKLQSVTKHNVYPHTIDLPLVRKSDRKHVSIKDYKPQEMNGKLALIACLETLRDKKATPADQAVSLCWVLHLYADLHQPFHAATLLTKDHPKGNGSGGVFSVLDPDGNKVNIHTYWDSLPGVQDTPEEVMRLANELAAEPDLQPQSMKEYRKNRKISEWIEESYESAANFGYAEDRIQFVHNADLASGKVSESQIPKMSVEYAQTAREITRSRLALAGQRLADQLTKTW